MIPIAVKAFCLAFDVCAAVVYFRFRRSFRTNHLTSPRPSSPALRHA